MSETTVSDIIEQKHRDDLARAAKASPKPKGTRIEKLRSIVEDHQASRVEGLYVDAFTASMLVQVYDALNEQNRETFVKLPLRKMVAVGWKLVRK